MSAKIYKFPKEPILRAPDVTPENVIDTIQQARTNYVDVTAIDIYNDVFHRLALSGFTLTPTNDAKDIWLICEALRSAMLRKYNIPHPLQVIADNMQTQDSLIMEEYELDNFDIDDDTVL